MVPEWRDGRWAAATRARPRRLLNFVLGALLMLGIGNYGPCLVLLSLFGMDPRAAFPIMMSTGALVIMVGGLKFMDTGRYDIRASLGLALGGIPAVLIAGLIVKSLLLGALRWLVVAVVTYAGCRDAAVGSGRGPAAGRQSYSLSSRDGGDVFFGLTMTARGARRQRRRHARLKPRATDNRNWFWGLEGRERRGFAPLTLRV